MDVTEVSLLAEFLPSGLLEVAANSNKALMRYIGACKTQAAEEALQYRVKYLLFATFRFGF